MVGNGGIAVRGIDKAEHQAIKAFTDWNDPIPRVVRQKVPVELEAIIRAPMDEPGWTANFVETVKRFPPGPDDAGCGLVTSTNGWVLVGPDGKRTFKLTAHVTYCDCRDVTDMLPLGLVSVQNRGVLGVSAIGLRTRRVSGGAPDV